MHEASSMGQAERVATNAAVLGLSKIVTSALLLAWQVALARALGVEQYGVYGTIGALMAIGAVVPDPGVGVIVVRDVARRPSEADRYLSASLVLHVGLAVLGYGWLLGAAALLGYEPDVRLLLAFVGINLVVDVVGSAGHSLLVAAERMALTAAIGAGHVILLVVLGVAALVAGGGLWLVYTAVLVAGLTRSLAYVAALRRCGRSPTRRLDGATVRHLFTAGLPLGIAAFLSLTFLHADKLATTALLGPSATAQLTASFVIVFGIVDLIGTTVLVAAYPAMSRQAGHGRRPLEAVRLLVTFDLLIGLPVVMALVALAPAVASRVFGPGYDGVAVVLTVMAWCIIVRMIEGALAQALTVEDRQRTVLAARTSGLALNLTLTLTLLPRIGVVGAAVGMLAGEVAIVALMLAALQPPPAWRAALGAAAARLLVPAATLVGATMLLQSVVTAPAAFALGTLGYCLLAVRTGAFSGEHRQLLASAVWHAPRAAVRRRRLQTRAGTKG